ncbi:MAG: LON peptidase substrate-binding domain-containing protein [bacterium]
MPNKRTFEIPIFPLPNIVFFPKTLLPLHIFEPRYQKMIEDALTSSKRIGITLLKEGWEQDYFGSPEVHLIGCVGEIQYSEKLDDGKYNIMLYGLSRVRILNFVQEKPYRIAKVKFLKDANFDHEEFNVNSETENFVQLVLRYLEEMGIENLNELLKLQSYSLESIINQIASVLDISIQEKQNLLEIDSLEARYEQLTNIIKDKLRVLKIAKSVKILPDDPQWN